MTTLGNLDLFALRKTALFCSARCPGSAILATYDQAAQWRDAGRCIISGFHSPVEKECLRIVAAHADDHYFAHIAPGSHTAHLAQEISDWPA